MAVGLEAAAIMTRLRSGALRCQDWTHLTQSDNWEDPEFVQSLSEHIPDELEGKKDTNTF
jgi:hypothetical protein